MHSPRRSCGLLGPCFNTGPSTRLTPLYFHFSPPNRAFSLFPRGTYPLSASSIYLALDASTTLSHCTTKQPYSLPVPSSGAITRSCTAFHRILLSAPQRPKAFHWDSFSFARRYYRNPRLFLLLSLVICLSPERPRTYHALFEQRPYRPLIASCRVRHRRRNLSIPYRGFPPISSF